MLFIWTIGTDNIEINGGKKTSIESKLWPKLVTI